MDWVVMAWVGPDGPDRYRFRVMGLASSGFGEFDVVFDPDGNVTEHRTPDLLPLVESEAEASDQLIESSFASKRPSTWRRRVVAYFTELGDEEIVDDSVNLNNEQFTAFNARQSQAWANAWACDDPHLRRVALQVACDWDGPPEDLLPTVADALGR